MTSRVSKTAFQLFLSTANTRLSKLLACHELLRVYPIRWQLFCLGTRFRDGLLPDSGVERLTPTREVAALANASPG